MQWSASKDGGQNSWGSETELSRAQGLLLAECHRYWDIGDIDFISLLTGEDPWTKVYTSEVSLLSAKLLRKSWGTSPPSITKRIKHVLS